MQFSFVHTTCLLPHISTHAHTRAHTRACILSKLAQHAVHALRFLCRILLLWLIQGKASDLLRCQTPQASRKNIEMTVFLKPLGRTPTPTARRRLKPEALVSSGCGEEDGKQLPSIMSSASVCTRQWHRLLLVHSHTQRDIQIKW